MVERGLIQEPSVPDVIVTAESPRSRYFPLVLPRSGDVEMALALFEALPPPNGTGQAPADFMIVFGDAEVHIKLESRQVTADRTEAVLSRDAGELAKLVDRIDRLGSTEHVPNENSNSGECEDSVVGYRLLAHAEGLPWFEYLHGPATFQCNDTSDPGNVRATVQTTPAGTGTGTGTGTGPGAQGRRGGPFEHPGSTPNTPGGFDGAFMSIMAELASGENGLMPKSGVVVIDPLQKKSKYNALVVPIGEDVDLAVATLKLKTVSKDVSLDPQQFMLVLEEDIVRIMLEVRGAEIRWRAPSADIIALTRNLIASPEDEIRKGFRSYEDDCRDILIPYRLFGRRLGKPWVEYAHGPLLFECIGDKYGLGRDGVSSSAPYSGPFMTQVSPSFMPMFMSSKSTEA